MTRAAQCDSDAPVAKDSSSPGPFDGNLAALARFQPDLARLLSDIVIPDRVQPVTGRDGSRTFKTTVKNGFASVWLGCSSMPTISARELFADFQSDGRSVCLPGVLTGLEPLVVAGKIPAFCAVFVAEENPLHIKLAFHLHDYTALIDAGRVVFLLSDRLEGMLVSFFKNHCGYSLPTRLLPVPQCGAVALAELRRKLEQAARAVLGVQHQITETNRIRLAERSHGSLPARPRLAIISNDARSETVEEAMRLHRAARHLGWPVERCVLDSPGACHVAGRLRAIHQVCSDLVLFVNCVDEHLSSLLPTGLPTASWLLGPLADASALERVGSSRLYLVPSRSVEDSLIDRGVEQGRIELCGPGADVVVCARSKEADQGEGLKPCDVAMMVDLPDDRPESCGVTLTSQVTLWKRVQEEVAKRVRRDESGDAASMLMQAERASGVSLKDRAGRDRFIRFVRGVIVPAISGRVAANTLAEHGFHVAVWGQHWPTSGRMAKARSGPIPKGEARYQVIHMAKVVVLGAVNPLVMGAALDVLAAGKYVVCLRGGRDFGSEFPMLASLAPHLRFYETVRELVEIVAELTNAGRLADNRMRTAREAVLAEHALDKRLLALAQRLREKHVVDSQRDHH